MDARKGERCMLPKENTWIENARLYPPAMVDRLLTALSNGAELHADETRKNFYDLDANGCTYFIYVSPVSGSITLIATWAKKLAPSVSKSDAPASWWRWITAHTKIGAYT